MADWGDVEKLMVDVGVIKSELVPLKQGVANFRSFQERGNRYFDRAEARMEAEDDRREKEEQARKIETERRQQKMAWVKIIALIVCPLIVALVIWGTVHWYNFTEDVIQMDKAWHDAGMPDPRPQKKPSARGAGIFVPVPPAQQESPSDATIPNSYRMNGDNQ